MKQNTPDTLTRREQAQLDCFILRGADSLRGSSLDRFSDDAIAHADAEEPSVEVPPCLMQQLRPAPGDLVREIQRHHEASEDEEDAERFDGMS